MKKFVLFLLALAMVALVITASAESDQNIAENLEVTEVTDLTENVPVLNDALEIEEWVDLDAEEEPEEEPEEELEWLEPEEEEEAPVEEEEIIEWIDLDAENLVFPEVICEVLEDCFELSEPAEGAPIAGGHYKGELIPVVDISGDYWLLQNGNYISADVLSIYNEDDIPGEAEARTRVNPRAPRDMKVVLCDPASEIETIAETYHSVVIFDTVDNMIHCFKFGVETLEIRLEPLSEYSLLYSYWTIDEDFLQECVYAIGWEEVMEKIYQYSLPGSYLVVFQ